jgi:CheY-like chemotaxis protein
MEKKESARILLIDDDEVTNMINTSLIVRNFKCTVKATTSAQDALNDFKDWVPGSQQQLPDVILLDINMPDMDGWEFLNAFEKLPAALSDRCRIFMLTSSIDNDDIERSKKYSCVTDFISKPLTFEKLKYIVSALPSTFNT